MLRYLFGFTIASVFVSFYGHLIEFRPPTPLAWKIDGAFSEHEISKVFEITETASASQREDFRNFGYGGAGHKVIYLHRHMDPHLRRRMMELARMAESSAGWKSTTSFNLTARCMEMIIYRGHNDTTSTAWHYDGGTFMTIAVMLTQRDQYEGGGVHFRRADISESFDLAVGDALVWRGWVNHHVSPVTSGLRRVFVMEFWSGRECETSGIDRAGDSLNDLRAALNVDNESDNLYEKYGDALCDDWPCEFAEEAEYAFHQYLKVSDYLALRVLGPILSIIPPRWPICVYTKLQAFKLLRSKVLRFYLLPVLPIIAIVCVLMFIALICKCCRRPVKVDCRDQPKKTD